MLLISSVFASEIQGGGEGDTSVYCSGYCKLSTRTQKEFFSPVYGEFPFRALRISREYLLRLYFDGKMKQIDDLQCAQVRESSKYLKNLSAISQHRLMWMCWNSLPRTLNLGMLGHFSGY